MAFSSMGYDYPRRSSYPPGWDFSERVSGYNARQAAQGHPVDPLTPTSYIHGPRGTLDQLFPRIRTYEVIYTDDALVMAGHGHGVHRRCFNCKAHETTTWRRSKLSPGKLVCPVSILKIASLSKFFFSFRSSATSAGCLSARIRFRGQKSFHAVGGCLGGWVSVTTGLTDTAIITTIIRQSYHPLLAPSTLLTP
jgi:hypothetical protein